MSDPDSAPTAVTPEPESSRFALAIGWVILATLLGCAFCIAMIEYFAEMGHISLAATGWAMGFVARKLLRGPNRVIGVAAALTIPLILIVSETAWIHWHLVKGEESWWAAFQVLPEFAQKFRNATLAGIVFTILGSASAYQQTTAGPVAGEGRAR